MKINVLPFIVFHYLLYSQHMDGLNNVVEVFSVFMKGENVSTEEHSSPSHGRAKVVVAIVNRH